MKFTITVNLTTLGNTITLEDNKEAAKKQARLRSACAGQVITTIEEIVIDQYKNTNDTGNKWVDAVDINNTNTLDFRTILRLHVTCIEASQVLVICSQEYRSQALMYAQKAWASISTVPLSIANLMELNLVINTCREIPYIIYPGTPPNSWHTWLSYHERCGRIIRATDLEKPLASDNQS